jgi:hypothetical protein
MKRTRELHSWDGSSSLDELTVTTEKFEQPLLDALKFGLYHVLWLAEWKIKPLSKLTDFYDRRVLQPWHERSCNDDCGVWTSTGTGKRRRGCVRTPLCMKLDLVHYDLDYKNNK